MNTKLKMLLWQKGVKQREIADHLHINESVMSDYVRGRRPVPPERAAAIAKYLGTTPEKIFTVAS